MIAVARDTGMVWLLRHKWPVLVCMALLFALLGLRLAHSRFSEDITFFLPAQPELVEEFGLFALTPPARLIFIELVYTGPVAAVSGTPAAPDTAGAADEALGKAARQLREGLAAPLFSAVHPSAAIPSAASLMELVPSLIQPDEAKHFSAMVATAPELLTRLQGIQAMLMSPGSMVLKKFLPADPLGMLRLLPARLAQAGFVAPAVASAVQNGQSDAPSALGGGSMAVMNPESGLASRDGLRRLLFVETPIPGLDSAGALAVTDALDALARNMPEGVSMSALSSHQHTAANVRTVKADMQRVLVASSLGLCSIFLLLLRSSASVPALVLPCFALVGAWGLLSLFSDISGITIAFGAVLLGIVVDYSLHVYCAVKAGIKPAAIPRTLGKPLLFSFLTTACAICAMFVSDLPGMRQVGMFSLLGCSVGLFLALFILPLLEKSARGEDWRLEKILAGQPARRYSLRAGPYLLLVCAVLITLWLGQGVQLQGDLRSLGVKDPSLAAAETSLARNWGGGLRQSAMLVSRADSLDEALTAADAALSSPGFVRLMSAHAGEFMSPLAFIPAPRRQEESRKAWAGFVAAGKEALQGAFGPGGAGAGLGFADTAFAPFLAMLAATPRPIDPALLDAAGLGLLRALFLPGLPGGGFGVLALTPDTPDLRAAAVALAADPLTRDSIRLFSPGRVAAQVSAAVAHDFRVMGLTALAAVALCLYLAQRSLPGFLLALTPSLTGGAALLLAFAVRGEPLNMFTVAALPLVIGLSAEYGIFMARHCVRPDSRSTPRAIALSGLTTLVGFGSLVLADHPAMHSLGLTVAVGIGAAIPAALWLVPYLAGVPASFTPPTAPEGSV